MLKLTLEFVDFDGTKKTKDLYFNISSKALAEKELRANGTWFDSLKAIADADGGTEADGNVIMDRFHEIIALAYGKYSVEGDDIYFRQSPQIFADFEATQAYDAFFMKVCTDADYAQTFINAVLPAELVAAVKAQQAKNEAAAAQSRPIVDVELPSAPSAVPPVVWPPQA